MISFRYHIVSLAAVLIALAAGVALGAGPLQKADESAATPETVVADISPALAGFEAAFTKANSERIVKDKLDDQVVLILTTPGAREAEVKSLAEYIESAGGSVGGEITLTSKLLDPANRQFAESVASQSAGDAVGDGEDYAKVVSAFARAFIAKDGADPDTLAQTIRSAFIEGGLIEYVSEPATTATMVLVVTGPHTSATEGEGIVLSSAIGAIDAAGNGAVVAGPASSGTEGGVVAQVRDSAATGSVSTVDVTDLGSGRVLAILALAQEIAGTSGAWGTSNAADGAYPR